MDQYKTLNYYRMDGAAVVEQLHSRKNGLTAAEARERLEHIGTNELKPIAKELAIITLLKQFKNILIVLLLVSGAISFFALHDKKTSVILTIIAVVNAVVGFFRNTKPKL